MCNYCGGSGVLDMSDYRVAPSSMKNICFCPYCKKGHKQSEELKIQASYYKAGMDRSKKESEPQKYGSFFDYLDNPTWPF